MNFINWRTKIEILKPDILLNYKVIIFFDYSVGGYYFFSEVFKGRGR